MRERPWRRLRRIINTVALVTIVAGPTLADAWEMRRMSARPYQPVRSTDPAAGHVAAYLARRNPVLDRLLPEGAGGTRFVARRDGPDGRALAGTATVVVAADEGTLERGEMVELHERAHLLHLLFPRGVTRLLERVTPPASDQYAATNIAEHFAEMAAQAWEIVTPSSGICYADGPVDRLRDMEQMVPGTAGFVLWYLREPTLDAVPDREALLAAASELAAPLRPEWETLWQALEARRRPDGTFEPWPVISRPERLAAQYAMARASEHWFVRIASVLLLPSLAVAKLLG